MDNQFIAIGAIVLAFSLYTWLTIINYKELIRTKPDRIKARRIYKKEKNRKLAKAFGITLKDK